MLCKALVLLVCFCFYSNPVYSDTPAPSYPTTTTPDTIDLDDGTITSPSGGCPSGTSTAYVYGSGSTIRFGECVNTFAVSYAINQALQGSGVSIDKAHYEWKYIHCFNEPGKFCSVDIEDRVNTETGEITDDTYWDELVVVVEITDSNGNVVETKTWTMDTWYEWTTSNAHSDNEVQEGSTYWQIHADNIEIYNHTDKVGTIRTPNSVGDIRFRITGYDEGNWDGYYGPIIKDLKTWFTYRANPCDDTALYDPSCPGYATAYAAWEYDQNCSANALYDPGCPGYATAYYNQQCSADPLYDSGCDGYATAYYNQQCSADPLYDSGCNGYAAAYLAQQCSLDAHYDSSCTGYSSAVTELTSDGTNVAGQGSDFVEVTKENNSTLYWILYYNQAEINAGGWKWECTGTSCTDDHGTISSVSVQGSGTGTHMFLYTKNASGNTVQPDNNKTYRFFKSSYLTTQCNANALYSVACDGYAAAYFTQQCNANPLYNSECSGYAAAYENQQCSINPLYSTNCSGYATAYYNQQCSADPLYDSGCPGYSTAYYNQQCSLDATYDSGCPGYESAYFTQQCNADPLYNSECPGYASAYFTQQCNADPLYDSACSGYDAAYFTQQCTANPLYNSECSGYDTAYFNQQCGLDALYNSECSGYDEAYLAQQCSINTLYDSSCNGYEAAYTLAQCNENPLYAESCEGYDISYFNQQCSFDPQYDTQCPGYQAPVEETVDPVAIDNGISTGDAVVDSILATPDLPTVNLIPAPEPMPEPMPEPEPEVVVELPTVEIPDVGTMDTGNTMPAPEPLGEVEQIEAEVEQQIEMELEIPDATQEQEEPSSDVEQSVDSDGPDEDSNDSDSSQEDSSTEDTEGDTEEAVEEETTEEETTEEETTEEETTEEEAVEEETTEEEAVEEETTEEEAVEEETTEEVVVKKKVTKKKVLTKAQKKKAKEKKMREIIKDKLNKLAEDMGKAKSLEAQQALQQIIAALINYVPGFNAYGQLAIPGVDFYNQDEIYKDKRIPENQRGLRNGLASQILWDKMVDMQYKGMD